MPVASAVRPSALASRAIRTTSTARGRSWGGERNPSSLQGRACPYPCRERRASRTRSPKGWLSGFLLVWLEGSRQAIRCHRASRAARTRSEWECAAEVGRPGAGGCVRYPAAPVLDADSLSELTIVSSRVVTAPLTFGSLSVMAGAGLEPATSSL